jgi:hypothetical protein
VDTLDEDFPVESALFKRSIECKSGLHEHAFAKRRRLS